MNPQFEHVLKVKEEGPLLIATCHYESLEEIAPLFRELSAVEFSAQSFSVIRSFDPTLIQWVALVLAAFNFVVINGWQHGFSLDGILRGLVVPN